MSRAERITPERFLRLPGAVSRLLRRSEEDAAPAAPVGPVALTALWDQVPTLDPRRHQHARLHRTATVRRVDPLKGLLVAAVAVTLASAAVAAWNEPASSRTGGGAMASSPWQRLYAQGWGQEGQRRAARPPSDAPPLEASPVAPPVPPPLSTPPVDLVPPPALP